MAPTHRLAAILRDAAKRPLLRMRLRDAAKRPLLRMRLRDAAKRPLLRMRSDMDLRGLGKRRHDRPMRYRKTSW
jgi:hypothetical protein